jgi:hypothetical protein
MHTCANKHITYTSRLQDQEGTAASNLRYQTDIACSVKGTLQRINQFHTIRLA